jgi:hypothetical protein
MSPERIYRTKDRPLPSPIASSEEFTDLTEKQRFNYQARLRHVEEITLRIEEWLTGAETDFFAFLDSIELDLYINQGAPVGSGEDHVSAWLFHTSWTFETSVEKMSRFISPKLREQIELPQPGLDAAIDQFRAWIRDQNQALTSVLDSFFAASSFDEAMANQIAVDTLLVNLLAGVTRARLNKRLDTLRP